MLIFVSEKIGHYFWRRVYFTLCVGCQSSHFYAQKCRIKATTLLTWKQKQTNIQSSQTGSKYHANTARTLSCLTESPRIHITSHNYILITLNNNKPRRQIWQLFDRRGVCASECKQRVSHAENAHVATTKLHTSLWNAAATYKLYAFIGLHSYWTSKQKLSGETSNQRARPCAARRLYILKMALQNTNVGNVLRIPRTRGKFVTQTVVLRKAVLTVDTCFWWL